MAQQYVMYALTFLLRLASLNETKPKPQSFTYPIKLATFSFESETAKVMCDSYTIDGGRPHISRNLLKLVPSSSKHEHVRTANTFGFFIKLLAFLSSTWWREIIIHGSSSKSYPEPNTPYLESQLLVLMTHHSSWISHPLSRDLAERYCFILSA